MKRMAILLTSVMCCALLAACGDKADPAATTTPSVAVTPSATAGAQTSDGIEPASGKIIEAMRDKLKAEGIEYEEVRVAAEMVGAEEGTSFELADGGRFELYRFDKLSDAYKKAVDTMEVELEGFDMKLPLAAFNGDTSLYLDGVKDEAKIKELFESLT